MKQPKWGKTGGAETGGNRFYQASSNESETDTHSTSSSSGWGPGGSSSNSGSFSSRSLTVGTSFGITQAYVGRLDPTER